MRQLNLEGEVGRKKEREGGGVGLALMACLPPRCAARPSPTAIPCGGRRLVFRPPLSRRRLPTSLSGSHLPRCSAYPSQATPSLHLRGFGAKPPRPGRPGPTDRQRLYSLVRAAILRHILRAALCPPHTSRAPSSVAQGHVRVRVQDPSRQASPWTPRPLGRSEAIRRGAPGVRRGPKVEPPRHPRILSSGGRWSALLSAIGSSP